MKRTILMAAIASLVSSTIFASIYYWIPENRPPISLAEALTQAEKLLGDDAKNRYCVSVNLHGDQTGEGKMGQWDLFFAAEDGSLQYVSIDMQGQTKSSQADPPLDWAKKEGRRESLADFRQRLEELFERESIEATFQLKGDTLLVSKDLREFEIYPLLESGDLSEKLEKVAGPSPTGFWLEIRKVDKPDLRTYPSAYLDYGPYWGWARGTYIGREKGTYYSVDFRYGMSLEFDLMEKIRAIGGDYRGW